MVKSEYARCAVFILYNVETWDIKVSNAEISRVKSTTNSV